MDVFGCSSSSIYGRAHSENTASWLLHCHRGSGGSVLYILQYAAKIRSSFKSGRRCLMEIPEILIHNYVVGCCLSWECISPPYDKASWFQIQEWHVHFLAMPRCFTFRVVREILPIFFFFQINYKDLYNISLNCMPVNIWF